MTRVPLTSDAVVREAAALADEWGLDRVTLSEVARRLRVQTPSLYSHVRDHAALLDGISALALSELARRITAGIAGRAGRAALEGFADAHRCFARESPGLWQALQRRAGATVVASEPARAVVQLHDAVLRGYDIPPAERVHATRLLGSTLNGYLTLEHIGSFDHSEPGTEASWHKTVMALDFLLGAWPTDSRSTP